MIKCVDVFLRTTKYEKNFWILSKRKQLKAIERLEIFIYQETPGKEDTGLPQSGDEWNLLRTHRYSCGTLVT